MSGGDGGARVFAGESEREKGRERERVGEVRGGAWRRLDAGGMKQAARRWPGACMRAAGTRPVLLARGQGRLASPAGWAGLLGRTVTGFM